MSLQDLTHSERFIFDNIEGIAGSFSEALYLAMIRADNNNLEKLRQGFPGEVDAFKKQQTKPEYFESLKQKVQS